MQPAKEPITNLEIPMDLRVTVWPIDKPIPYARNARKISPKAIDKVALRVDKA